MTNLVYAPLEASSTETPMNTRRHFIQQSLFLSLSALGTRSLLTAQTVNDLKSSGTTSQGIVSTEHPATLYPYIHNDYFQRMSMKPNLDGGGGPDLDLHETLDWLRKIDNMTRGCPKLVVLVGYQQGGHDALYPSLVPLNSKLQLPEFADVSESLSWFMREARKYHTLCTVHTNVMDAYKDSPLWDEYEKADMFSRKADGSLVKTGFWRNRDCYHVSQAKEWCEGRMQTRIEALLDALPTIKESGVLYFDANVHFEPSPWHKISSEDEQEAFKAMCCWLRAKHGIDALGEIFQPVHYGYHPMGISLQKFTLETGMQVPSYLMSCGMGGEPLLGSGSQLEGSGYWKTPAVELTNDAKGGQGQSKQGFYFNNLPCFYLNRLLRISVDQNGGVQFSDDVQTSLIDDPASGQKKIVMTRKGKLMRDGFDVFVPAVWRANREIMAFSMTGTSRLWEFPDEWRDVLAVDIYDLTEEGPVLAEAGRDISRGAITLALKAKSPVSIVPCGTDIHAEAAIQPVGEAIFLDDDRETQGDWMGRYGSEGYDMAGLPGKLPPGVKLNYIGMENLSWSHDFALDHSALQNPLNEGQRIAAARTCTLHAIAEVLCERSIEVALYSAGLDGKDRQMLLEAVDPATMKVLSSRLIRTVKGGVYSRFEVKGHVYLRLTRLLHENMGPVDQPLLSGIFFGRKNIQT